MACNAIQSTRSAPQVQARSPISVHSVPAHRQPERRLRRLTLLVIALIALAIAFAAYLRHRTEVPGWEDRPSPIPTRGITQPALLAELNLPGPALTPNAYQDLFKYFLEGFVNYRSPLGARAFYPGAHSDNGRLSDGLEGFARIFPLAAAWMASGQPDRLRLGDHEISVSQLFTQGLLAGTDPDGPEYWGKLADYSQPAYETGDIAVALWISRAQIWNHLSAAQQEQVGAWLMQTLDIRMYPGNWSLVPLVVHRSLKTLGVDVSRYDERAETTFERFQSLYRGDGWFVDPPNGFDYYNSWAIHYHLFWLNQMDPSFHGAFIRSAESAFGNSFKYLFGPNGQPMYGRSVCYRMGAATGLLTAAAIGTPTSLPTGEAMRALDSSIRYFANHQALAAGSVTQGFCGTDLRVVDEYTGPASCLQGLRALTVAFFLEPTLHVFQTVREPLPVETGDFSVHNATTGWTITGDHRSGNVTLTVDGNPPGQQLPLAPYSLRRRVMEFILHRPYRPNNHRSLYFSRSYSTATPEVACRRNGED